VKKLKPLLAEKDSGVPLENSMPTPLKLLTTELPYDPEIPLLVIYANELEVVS
jgi:hypothetical protein